MRYLLPLALAAILAGCSSDNSTVKTEDGEVTVEQSGESVTIESTSNGKSETMKINEESGEIKMTTGDGSTVTGGTKIPEAFPLKVPAGVTVENAMHNTDGSTGEQTFVVQYTSSQAITEAAGDFEKQLKEKGLTVDRSEQTSDGNTSIYLNAQSEKILAGVQVSAEEGKTNVIINWTAQK